MVNSIAYYRLVGKTIHFIPKRRYKGERRLVVEGVEIRDFQFVRGYYILGKDCRYFFNICNRDTRFLMDHWIIL